jgi:hypothetical protein
LAISTDEPTTTGNDPNWSCISGPYFCESARMERCGSAPTRLRLPMIVHGFGPGGRLYTRRLRRGTAFSNSTVASTTPRKDAHVGSSIRIELELKPADAECCS